MGKRLIEEPWTMVAAEYNQYILVFVDIFTKWVEIIPIKKTNGKTIESELHKRIVLRWGRPRILHTDNGTEFVNGSIQELTEKFGIRHTKTPRYYPQVNPTEGYNRTIKEIIRAYIQEDYTTWNENVYDLQFAINTSKNSSTQYTPAFLNLVRDLQPLQSLIWTKQTRNKPLTIIYVEDL